MKRISCIPEGKYLLQKRYSKECFLWHIEIVNVSNRTNRFSQFQTKTPIIGGGQTPTYNGGLLDIAGGYKDFDGGRFRSNSHRKANLPSLKAQCSL